MEATRPTNQLKPDANSKHSLDPPFHHRKSTPTQSQIISNHNFLDREERLITRPASLLLLALERTERVGARVARSLTNERLGVLPRKGMAESELALVAECIETVLTIGPSRESISVTVLSKHKQNM